MKYRLNPYIQTILLLITLTLCSCEDDWQQEKAYLPSDYISFASTLEPINATANTRTHSGHIMMESEDWVIEGKTVNTRVAPTTSLSGTAGVIAYKDAATSPAIDDKSFTFDNDALMATSSPVPWSSVSDAETALHVFAYAPYDVVHATPSPAATINTATATPTLSFNVPDAVGNQIDLLAANADVTKANFGTSVPLTFNHALTAIRFKVDFACKVKSLYIKGVYKSGIYSIGGDWSGQTTPQNYSFGEELFTASGTNYAAEDFLIDGSNTMMLMPQTVPGGATVVLTYDDNMTLTASISGHEWQKGKRITYTISKSGISYIYFDLAAGNVDIEDNTYSGKVYNNAGTLVTVSGTHTSENKYYVYQTTSSNRNNIIWSDNSNPGKCTPTGLSTLYSDLSYSSKTWSEYITNNKNFSTVNSAWSAAASERNATSNRIRITETSVTPSGLDVDITIDNIWSNYPSGGTGSKTTTGSIIIGPGGPGVSGNQYGTSESGQWSKYQLNTFNRYEHVTLRLKGDNRLNNLMYMGHPNSQKAAPNHAYLKITSADGDGSPNGSLFVYCTNQNNSAAIGASDNDVTPPCNSLYFNGGTVYSYSIGPFGGAVGGGSNNQADIYFYDGCVFTGVTSGRGATIGGGGGSTGRGEDATIHINGGRIYAYQYGASVPGVAIGAGGSERSTGNTGYVYISGGDIYAESVGGCAIGGGVSGQSNGGDAVIEISGGTITAKSIDGSISGTSYQPANAIGGGRGGTQGNGGSVSSMVISGGTIYTGSIGGGSTLRPSGYIGTANITLSGSAVVQGQFIMAAGAASAPSFEMTGGTLRPNNAGGGSFTYVKPDGGAVYIEDGTFSMSGGTISGFSVQKGGAVYIENGSFTMTGGTIEDCSADYGGAVYIGGGTVNISDGTIADNRSSGSGGGVYVDNGSFTMSAGTITGIYAVKNGGGVSVSSSTSDVTVNITGGSITGNSAGEYGGGLSVVPDASYDATVILGVASQGWTNPDISGNSAIQGGGGVYANGADAAITINSGKVKDNIVSALVPNPDVANDGGLVTLNDGDVTHVVVTYHMNDGSIPETTATQKIVTSTRSVLNMPSWSISGYTLSWNSNADGSGDTYTNGQEVNLTSGLHLYAIWTPNP